MAFEQAVFLDNLGNSFDIGVTESGKLHVKVDGSSIVLNAVSGALEAVAQVVVSADTDNIIVAGADGGAFLSNEEVQDAIGQAIISATDGLDYDDVNNAISAAVASLAASDTDSIAMAVADTAGAKTITASLVVDPITDNRLEVTADGAKVMIPATTNAHAVVSGETFKTTVDGVEASTVLVELQDIFGNHKGEIIE